MAKILVTGSTGFVGRNLVPALVADNHEVTLYLRAETEQQRVQSAYDQIPVVSAEALSKGSKLRFDTVVHLAGLAHVSEADKNAYHQGNAVLTERLVDLSISAGVRKFIFLSSISAVTGKSADFVITDQTQPAPTSPYGVSKLAAEKHVSAFAQDGGFGISIRPPLIFGKDAPGNWNLLQKLAATGLPLPFASVNNKRSFVSVKTIVDFICHLVDADVTPETSGNYCIAEKNAISLSKTLLHLRKGMGKNPRLFPFPAQLFELAGQMTGRGGIVRSLLGNLVLDSSRVYRVFDFQPSATIEKEIEQSGQGFIENRAGNV